MCGVVPPTMRTCLLQIQLSRASCGCVAVIGVPIAKPSEQIGPATHYGRQYVTVMRRRSGSTWTVSPYVLARSFQVGRSCWVAVWTSQFW